MTTKNKSRTRHPDVYPTGITKAVGDAVAQRIACGYTDEQIMTGLGVDAKLVAAVWAHLNWCVEHEDDE